RNVRQVFTSVLDRTQPAVPDSRSAKSRWGAEHIPEDARAAVLERDVGSLLAPPRGVSRGKQGSQRLPVRTPIGCGGPHASRSASPRARARVATTYCPLRAPR